MKQLSIYLCTAVLLFGCAGNETTTANTEPVADAPGAMATEARMETAKPNIVELASGTPSLSTLVQALQAADLAGALQEGGPFTVFAPTNEAFAALPAGTLENLLKPENKQQLTDILTYHVVEGKVMASDLSNGMSANTLNGKDVRVMIEGSNVKINESNVAMPDVEASNGVVHVVDKVMLPPAGM